MERNEWVCVLCGVSVISSGQQNSTSSASGSDYEGFWKLRMRKSQSNGHSLEDVTPCLDFCRKVYSLMK